jgi:hypothetical protein
MWPMWQTGRPGCGTSPHILESLKSSVGIWWHSDSREWQVGFGQDNLLFPMNLWWDSVLLLETEVLRGLENKEQSPPKKFWDMWSQRLDGRHQKRQLWWGKLWRFKQSLGAQEAKDTVVGSPGESKFPWEVALDWEHVWHGSMEKWRTWASMVFPSLASESPSAWGCRNRALSLQLVESTSSRNGWLAGGVCYQTELKTVNNHSPMNPETPEHCLVAMAWNSELSKAAKNSNTCQLLLCNQCQGLF